MKKVVVKQDPEKEIPTEILANDISDIANGVRAVLGGRLNRRALVLLIQANCVGKISIVTINNVINSIESLDKAYLRK
ncbi:MAG TPA: hypothetical protein VLJ17_24770 [Xanthobacteraceae bacterium]|nr:hypothetical protein [Xanthobacteraceae bacterium]